MRPARGLLFVRPIETPETIGNGRIIFTPNTRDAMTTHQMEVVSIGAPGICEDEDCERSHEPSDPTFQFPNTSLERVRCRSLAQVHPANITIGDWVLVRHRGLTETHEDGLYCAHQDDILAILESPGITGPSK